jgi:hypothetical protein
MSALANNELHPELLEVANEEGVSLRIDADDTIQIQADDAEHAASAAVEFAWLAAKALKERDAARVETKAIREAANNLRNLAEDVAEEELPFDELRDAVDCFDAAVAEVAP